MKRKRIVCAALLLRNGVIFGAPKHSQARKNVIKMMANHGESGSDIYWELKDAKRGFMANDGKFYDSIEAYKIALAAGQITEKEIAKLVSEDLY